MAKIQRDELPATAIRVLEFVEIAQTDAPGKWLDRVDLATAAGKRTLNAAEMAHLEHLAALEFIEMKRPVGAVAYHYRIVD